MFSLAAEMVREQAGSAVGVFLVMLAYRPFIIIHVSLVVATGLTRNMNHITVNTDSAISHAGLYIGSVIILFTIGIRFLALDILATAKIITAYRSCL